MDMSIDYPLGTGKRVRVRGRDDEGVIVDAGKNVGTVYCVGVHFESTGEVVYYEQRAVTPTR
jgi:hypothetical protein